MGRARRTRLVGTDAKPVRAWSPFPKDPQGEFSHLPSPGDAKGAPAATSVQPRRSLRRGH
jgi:hypothetical protein